MTTTIASGTYGQSVKLDYNSIYTVLSQPHNGFAHVYARDPGMAIISRYKDGSAYTVMVEELFDDVDSSILKSIYNVKFADDDISSAIKLFLKLIKSPRKEYIRLIYKNIGQFMILENKYITAYSHKYTRRTIPKNRKRHAT